MLTKIRQKLHAWAEPVERWLPPVRRKAVSLHAPKQPGLPPAHPLPSGAVLPPAGTGRETAGHGKPPPTPPKAAGAGRKLRTIFCIDPGREHIP